MCGCQPDTGQNKIYIAIYCEYNVFFKGMMLDGRVNANGSAHVFPADMIVDAMKLQG